MTQSIQKALCKSHNRNRGIFAGMHIHMGRQFSGNKKRSFGFSCGLIVCGAEIKLSKLGKHSSSESNPAYYRNVHCKPLHTCSKYINFIENEGKGEHNISNM